MFKFNKGVVIRLNNIQLSVNNKQMMFVSNSGKFKHYTVPNDLLFSTPAQPRFSFEGMIFIQRCRLYFQVKKIAGLCGQKLVRHKQTIFLFVSDR
jgi:hypothetical protein